MLSKGVKKFTAVTLKLSLYVLTSATNTRVLGKVTNSKLKMVVRHGLFIL